MAVKYTQIAELLNIAVRHIGRMRYQALLKDIKGTQAYLKNQSFRETMDRLERQLTTGRSKPPKEAGVRQAAPKSPLLSRPGLNPRR